MNEHIVCSANRCGKYLLLGLRHWDVFMRETYEQLECEISRGDFEQGFLTNKGRFVNRLSAWRIAELEGQIVKRVGGDESGGGTLYSENLY
jgi:hypothetical protein